MNKIRRLGLLIAIATLIVGVGGVTHALKAPHNYEKVGACNACHARNAGPVTGFMQITSFNTLCFNSDRGCHLDGHVKAGNKALTVLNASNRFKNIIRNSNYANYSTNKKQSSHGWKVPNTNPDAGATVEWHPMPELKGNVALYRKITCMRCHRAHGDTGPSGQTIYRSFLRDDPKGDSICYQCHAARRINSVRASLPAGKHYSHPVEVNYSSASAAKPGYFEPTPTLTAGYNASARPRLYTTIGGVKGAVVCSTCHGPLHAADSNPYTFDNLSAYNQQNAYSSSAGNLLRQYPMSKAGHENKLCKSCHKVSAHRNFTKCSDCHEPHKKSGDKNLFLIKTSIMTPYGKRSVKFESTSTMASRWGIYSGSTPTDKSQRSKGVCQVCHRYTSNHRAYSTAGSKRDHNYLGGTSNRFKFCPDCHKHINTNSTGAFLPVGCAGCHNDPPTIGKHSKHTGGSAGYVTWKWSDATMHDDRNAANYGFSCGRCHSPWTPYTATAGSDNYEGRNHYGLSAPIAQKIYTADIGFKNVSKLPQNPTNASYTYGGAGTPDTTSGAPYFRTPTNGTCSNLYCHGQFYGGYTSNNPNFNDAATQSCVGSCHGTTSRKAPGVNGTGEWGAHRRHVGYTSQQYGDGTPNFRCNACHYATAGLNNETTVTSRVYHVNGKTNVRFAPEYGYSASTYKGLNDYSGATNTAIIPASKTPYYTCGKIYCHSDGSRTDAAIQGGYSSAASYSTRAMAFPSWSSMKNFTTTTGGIRRCTRCHGNDIYRGITSAMPEYATRPGKGNAHQTHIITNRILCYACHSNTVGTDNRTINTANHVNKTYDVNMAAAYGGSWNSSAKRCSNVKCHGQKLTPAWNDPAKCQDCHFTSTGVAASNYTSEKKGYLDSYKFRNFTVQNSMPRIYSSEWVKTGHGRNNASQYPSSNNFGANKNCNNCHEGTLRHVTSNAANNPFRLISTNPVLLCKGCHTTYKTHSRSEMGYGNTSWKGFSSVDGSGTKCVDCHDPHGDSNRYMIKRYINFTTGSDKYGRVLGTNLVKQVTFSTIGSNTLLTWSSFVKADFSGICQRCHNTQTEMKYFNKATFTPTHNAGSKCTDCHLHSAGFKPKACSGCHFFPPKDSGAGSDPNGVGGRMKHARHVNWTSPYVDKSYDNLENAPSPTMYNFACKKCHAGNHASDSTNPRQVDVLFDSTAYPKNGGAAAHVRFSGWTETGAEADNYDYMYSSGKCSNLYCHGNFAGGKTTNVARFDNTSAAAGANWSRVQRCGACHGAKAADAPAGGAHGKHVSTYTLACKTCHRDVASTNANGFGTYSVTNKIYHVDGKTRLTFYTTEARIGGAVKYRNSAIQAQATTAVSSYSFCQSLYCHSKGTSTLKPYTAVAAYSNYTAKWDLSNLPASPTEKCSYCHGSRKTAGGYAGITSAMPNYPSGSPKVNSHKKHVVDNGFNCSACHAKTVKGFATISSVNFHVNKVADVYFPAAYSGIYNGDKSCSRVKCHGKRRTPAWGGTVGCTNCHFSAEGAADADIMDYSFRNYSKLSSVPKIYSGEWMASGHGKTGANYNRTNNPAAGKICNACHVSSVKHNTGSNFFRLTGLGGGTDPSSLCKRCHGTGSSQLQASGFGTKTGIQGHTQQILSSVGYSNLTTWRFKPKCTDCHDPHGDAQASSGNIAMIRNTYLYNYSGSDSAGRPIRFGSLTTAVFEKYTGTKSFDNGDSTKGRLCAACHKRAAHNGGPYTGHNNQGLDCRSCHKHKQGFNPSGCNGCHGDSTITIDRANWAPPKGPTGWSDSLTNMSSLHRPHAYNPKSRPGFGNQTGFACQYCHDDTVPSTVNHNNDKNLANLSNMTSTTGWNGMTKASKVDYGTGVKNPANDTCSNTKCHTPRAYIRTWQKPKDCDDCHGYTKGRGTSGLTGRQFNLQTTQSHKIHINWTANAPAGRKNYKFACSNCHYNWVTNNNYSTHYSGQVNITSGGTVNTKGGQFYDRGRSFKGFTTGGELNGNLSTCSNVYCHGNFTNGGPNGDAVAGVPEWKKGATAVNCNSCHRGRDDGADGSLMPERHPKHAASTAGNYNFACSKCHLWTVSNNTTVQFNYSSHVNGVKDVKFDSVSGNFTASTRRCKNSYCHSLGDTQGAPYTMANWTADWDETASGKLAGKACSYCHGNRIYAGITAAMPNYANQAHAKHARNATSDNFRCNVCHAATVSAAGLIVSNANHANKFKNISVIATYKSGQTGYSSTVALKKTCKNIKCHGGRTTPLWTLSTGINCMDCHKSTTGDTDKRIKEIKVYQNFSAAGSTAPKIYSSIWATRGHGRQSADGAYPVSGNSAANKTCTNCHGAGETRASGLATKHGTGTNPFRLITAPGRPNVLCESCHGTNATNPGKGTRTGIQTHASSVSKQGQNFDIKCIDCHDPHGDNNIYMVHSTISRPNTALSVKSQISNANGSILTTATTLRNVDFVNNVYTTDYAKKTQAPRICQTCHRETQKPRSSTYQRYRWNGSNDTQHGTTKCTGCHSHDSGFKGVRCDGCHGNPPTGIQTILSGSGRTNEFKERPSGNTSSEPNTAGAHLKHVQVFGSDSVTCSYCHQGGMYGSGSKNSNIDIGFKAFAVYSGYTQNYNGQAAVKSGFYGYSGYGVGSGTNQKCNNMKCHGGGGWLTASYGTVTAPTWTVSNTAACGKCHGAKKATGSSGSWPTTYAHPTHAGTGGTQANLMCNVCHATTVIANNTTLSDTMHVNGRANIGFGNEFRVHTTTSAYSDDGNYVNNNVAGKCENTYCHSKGTYIGGVPYNNAANFSNFTAGWNDIRGGYKKSSPTTKAKCNYCHGNTQFVGVTSAMPGYTDGTPKANKHSKHVRTYNFLCNACHVDVARNNTSISSSSLHVNKGYDINYTTVRSIVNNSAGNYNAGRCENLYCHSLGNIASSALPNYTAKWAADMITGGYKTGMKCKYCHGAKSIPFTGMTAAMPNYPTGTPKANAHNRHVAKYGFTCTECHMKVTTNNTSIDAAGGIGLHVNKQYNVYFKPSIAGRPQINNTGIYKYQSGATGSSCKNTYCHSRGTDWTRPYSTRTSFSNFTAQWGDALGSYKRAVGLKAKCNYCHGNRLFSGMTSAMPNYSTQIKKNSHKRHVVGYGFTCKACHKYVTTNNSSIDAAGGIGRHVNGSYNVDFSNSFNNNTGLYDFIGLNSLNKCKNTYCHSRGTDFVKPYSTRTSFANFTARWGDTLGTGSYKQAVGAKAKCNYCHGNKAYTGTTSAMPNYSGNVGAVKAKANSHRIHVVGNGYTCKECHYGVVQNNTSISDRVRHANAFYNISFAPGRREQAGKMYSSVWSANGVQGTLGGTCMRTTCHGTSKPKWGDPNTASCTACHVSNVVDTDDSARVDGTAAKLYSTEWATTGHGKQAGNYRGSANAGANKTCLNCHRSSVAHKDPLNPFRLYTAAQHVDDFCRDCHRSGGGTSGKSATVLSHNSSVLRGAGYNGGGNGWARWNFKPKCVDCHDPHGDKNNFMLHRQANFTSNSNKFGQWSTNDRAQLTFTSVGDPAWGDYVNSSFTGVCQRCHTATDGKVDNFNKNTWNSGHNSGSRCTDCHSHDTGFKPAGESTGGKPCASCHSTLFDPMNSGTSSSHHVMMNDYTAFQNITLFDGSKLFDKSRRCLMCHVDHDNFSPKAKPGNRLRRGMNLRINGSVLSIRSGINTDFWPAKRAGKYAASSPLTGPSGSFGVCISCHKNVQTKNTTSQMEDRSTKARNFSIALYTSSSHNFQILSGFNNFSGGSSFRANCTKCHNSRIIDKSGTEGQKNSRYRFGLHDGKYPSLLNYSSQAIGSKPEIEELCYKCHDNTTRQGGGPGEIYDYYSTIQMNTGAKMIKTAIVAKTSGHPIDSELMAGRHRPDEFYNVTGTVAANANPPSTRFWNFSSTRHVECTDCHNTHGGNASITRTVGGPFRGKKNSSETQQVYSAGNKIAGAQAGAWGVRLDFTGVAKGGTPKFTKTSQVTYQYELCLKCHSNFAYGASARGVPSGLPDGTALGALPYENLDASVPQVNIAKMINPANFGYHPIYAKGKNQPPKTAAGALWLSSKSNWMYKDRQTNRTAFIAVSGLSWTFVPPFSQHSLLGCSDCHQADNTGSAAARVPFQSGQTVPAYASWSGIAGGMAETNLSKYGDGKYAKYVVPNSAGILRVIVQYQGSTPAVPPNSEPTETKAIVVGYSEDPEAADRSNTLAGCLVSTCASNIGTGTVKFSLSNARYEVSLTNQTWAALGDADNAVQFTVDASNDNPVRIDYLGLEAVYTTAGDVRGPHGSLQRWILTDVDKDILFDANNDNNLTWHATGGDGTDQPNKNLIGNELRVFCYNCHRRDVYGDEADGDGGALYDYGRMAHPPDGPAMDSTFNVWGIGCLTCHAGGASGEIHGSFANSTTAPGFWGATRNNLQRPRGVRLMNGAVVNFNPQTGTCYTVSATTAFATSGCSGQHTVGAQNSISTAPAYQYQTNSGW